MSGTHKIRHVKKPKSLIHNEEEFTNRKKNNPIKSISEMQSYKKRKYMMYFQ